LRRSQYTSIMINMGILQGKTSLIIMLNLQSLMKVVRKGSEKLWMTFRKPKY
jgi:hypothetical protein